MLVILKSNSFYSFRGIIGKKVIATPSENGGCDISVAELYRVCNNDPYGCYAMGFNMQADTTYHFSTNDFEVVPPKLQNCSDSNVGKGWEGYYDQKPVKRSKFRV